MITGTSGSGGPAAAVPVLLFVVILVGAAGFVVAEGTPVAPHRAAGPPGTAYAVPRAENRSAACDALNSNASLNATVAGIYAGLPNLTPGTPAPINGSPPAPLSDYPPLAEADAATDAAWIAICESPAFAADLRADGPDNVTGGLELSGSGDYLLHFGIVSDGPCQRASDDLGSGCTLDTEWTYDLRTGASTGPSTSELGIGILGGAPLAFPLEIGAIGNVSRGSTSWVNYSLTLVNAVTPRMDRFGLEVKTVDCGAVTGPVAIDLRDNQGVRLASADGTTGNWSFGASATVPTSGTISIVSDRLLVGDELIMIDHQGGGQTGQPIGNWTGGWDGCGFT